MARERHLLADIYRRLLFAFGEQGWWPTTPPGRLEPVYDPAFKRRPRSARERLEIAIGAILTQSTAWHNAALALANLKRHRLLDRKKLLALAPARLAALIRSSGYHRQKAKKLKAFLAARPRPRRAELLAVWGLGPETADSILLYAYNQPVFVVDAYTRRLLSRLGLIGKKGEKESYAGIQSRFLAALPADAALFNEYHALIVRHGKECCTARRPRCANCPLTLCPTR